MGAESLGALVGTTGKWLPVRGALHRRGHCERRRINALRARSLTARAPPPASTPTRVRWIPAGAAGTGALLDEHGGDREAMEQQRHGQADRAAADDEHVRLVRIDRHDRDLRGRDQRRRTERYVDGELDVGELLTANAHLAQCAACQGRVERERQFRRLLARQPRESAPVELRAAIRERLSRSARRTAFSRWLIAPAALAAAVVLLLVLPPSRPAHRSIDGGGPSGLN